ncbi:MAG: toll/interleukin-1 receptor domain-containing protein [Clostridiales bacterium]|nr:toll/interleukin-1 receptor domain-containing protein [Clostridiales bacterium]
MEQRRYCAFISYRHYTPDKEIAQRLHTLIETYSIPSALRGDTGLKHPGNVFRDQEELPLSPNLGKDIETALDNSDWLICVCSPRYLESRWCMRELEYFIEHRGRDRVLAVLAEGEPQDAFPALLCKGKDAQGNEIDIEPLAADVRSATLRGSLKKLKKEKLRILAPMLGTTFDGLYMRQKRRVRRNAAAVACAALVAAGGIFGYLSYQKYRLEAERVASVKNEYDLLIEQASSAVTDGRKAFARDVLLKARELSDSIGGYREEPLVSLLEQACYAGSLSPEVKLDSAVDYFAVSAKRATQFFSPDGTKVLIPSSGYVLDCCDAATGRLLWSSSFSELITSARWKEDSSRVVVTSHMGHLVRLIDAGTGKTINDLDNISWVSTACFHGDDVLAVFEQGFLIWDTVNDPDAEKMLWYKTERSYQGSSGLAFGDKYLVRFDSEGFDIVNTDGPIFVYMLETPYKVINGYALSPDGKKLFVHQFKDVFVCDIETDEILWQVSREKAVQHVDEIPESMGEPPVWAGNYIFDNERTDASDYLGYTGVVYDAGTGEILYTLENTFCAAATPDGRYFLCGDGVHDAATGELVLSSVSYLYAADPAGERYLSSGYILTGMGSGTQYVQDAYDGSLYFERNDMHRVISPDDMYSVINEVNGPGFTVLKMDGTNWQYKVRDFTPGYRINFSPDSRLVALSSAYNAIAVYELADGERVYLSDEWSFKCEVDGFTFSSDSRFLMCANKEKDLFIVADMKTGQTLYRLCADRPVREWGFDEKTDDAVVLYEDGSALIGNIFTSAEEVLSYARQLSAEK